MDAPWLNAEARAESAQSSPSRSPRRVTERVSISGIWPSVAKDSSSGRRALAMLREQVTDHACPIDLPAGLFAQLDARSGVDWLAGNEG